MPHIRKPENRLMSKELNPVLKKPQKILIFSRSDGLIYAPAMFVQTTARQTRKNSIRFGCDKN
jgi:hypothetical protein